MSIKTKLKSSQKGQAMVEFALVIGLLLAFIFIVIEAGRVFQAWVTVQNAARDAARYAVTGQYNETGTFVTPECPIGTPTSRWQVCSVKDEALRAAAGLNIDPTAGPTTPRGFGTQVCDPNNCPPESVGLPGQPTRVRVFYNVEILTPIFRPIAPYIRVMGQVEAVTENYDQVSPNEIIITEVEGTEGSPELPNEADLAIEKKGPGSAVYSLEDFDYIIKVTNHGPFDTPSVQVVDLLPSAIVTVTNITVTDGVDPVDGAVCSVDILAPQIDCVIPFLEATVNGGVPISITVTAKANPPEFNSNPGIASVTIPNEVSVFNQISTLDPDLSDNTATVDTEILPWADLEILKTRTNAGSDTGGMYVIGEDVIFEIQVKNFGPNGVFGFEIVDTLPSGLDYVSDDRGCNITGNILTCSTSPDASAIFASNAITTVHVTAKATVGGYPLTNVAEVRRISGSTWPTERDEVNDSGDHWQLSTETDNVDEADAEALTPNLVIDKTWTPYKSGDNAILIDVPNTYFINIANNGSGKARDVFVTDILASGAQVTRIAGDFKNCVLASSQIACDPLPEIPAGGSAQLIIDFIPRSVTSGMLNTVEVISNDGLIPKVTKTVSTPVIRLYDIGISKKALTEDPAIGEPVQFEVVWTNHGPSLADRFQLHDDFNLEGLTVDLTDVSIDVSNNNVDCPSSISKTEFNCTITNMAVGETWALTMTLTPDSGGTIKNTVSVSDTDDSRGEEPDEAQDDITIGPEADLSISDPINDNDSSTTATISDEEINFTLQIHNAGPDPATNVVITNTVQFNVGVMKAITITHSGGSCTDSAAGDGSTPITVLCSLSSLNSGATEEFYVTIAYSKTLTIPELTNFAEVKSSTSDPDQSNNTTDFTLDSTNLTPLMPINNRRNLESPARIVYWQTYTYWRF